MIDVHRYGSNCRILTWIPKQAVNGDDKPKLSSQAWMSLYLQGMDVITSIMEI